MALGHSHEQWRYRYLGGTIGTLLYTTDTTNNYLSSLTKQEMTPHPAHDMGVIARGFLLRTVI